MLRDRRREPDYKVVMQPEGLQKRIKAARKEREAITAQTVQIRARLEELRRQEQDILAKQRPLIKQIQEIEAPLFDLDMEISRIARALGGKTG